MCIENHIFGRKVKFKQYVLSPEMPWIHFGKLK